VIGVDVRPRLAARIRVNAARAPLSAFGGVFAAALVAGTVRVAVASTERPTLRAAAINRPTDLFIPGEMTRITEGHLTPAERPSFDAKLAKLHDWFLEGSRCEARAGARLVVWPEQNLLVFSETKPRFWREPARSRPRSAAISRWARGPFIPASRGRSRTSSC